MKKVIKYTLAAPGFLLSLFLAFAVSTPLRADKRAEISFEKQTHDFGTVSENDGDISCEFKFTNTGTSPLLIIRAQASCGCTTPEYPKHPIRPGESGVVSVTYHAKGRPGTFQKSIYIYDNSTANHRTVLLITGNVISSKQPEEIYTQSLGAGLRMKNRSLSFFDLYPNRPNRTRSLTVYNESDQSIQLAFNNVPKHIYVESDPQIIEPKKEGKILITYYTSRVKDWGLQKDFFNVTVKGKETQMKENRIAVTADICEDFSRLSKKEKSNAPAIDVAQTAVNFGTATQDKTITIPIRNNGKSKLLIRKIQNNEPDIFSCKTSDTVLKPGETGKLEITFHPNKSRLASINHHITLICNDPQNSRIIINMTADK